MVLYIHIDRGHLEYIVKYFIFQSMSVCCKQKREFVFLFCAHVFFPCTHEFVNNHGAHMSYTGLLMLLQRRGLFNCIYLKKNMDESSASLNRFEDTKGVIRSRKLMFVFVFFACLFDGI